MQGVVRIDQFFANSALRQRTDGQVRIPQACKSGHGQHAPDPCPRVLIGIFISMTQVEYRCEFHEEVKGNIPGWAVNMAMNQCVDTMIDGLLQHMALLKT